MIERFNHWLLKTLQWAWIPLLLMSCLAMLMIVSINEADWVTENGMILAAVAWGLTFGWFLSFTRFRSWVAAAYSLVLSILVILIGIGNLVSPFFSAVRSPYFVWITSLNLRAWNLIYRLSGWYQALILTKPVEDNGFFIFLLSLILWLASSWLAWSVMRNQRPFEGLLPYGFLLAVNVHLSHQSSGTFWLFSLLALPLMIRSTFVRNQDRWDQRGIDYPDSLGLDWSLSVGILTVLISSVALAVSIFGTPEGLQSLNKLVTTTRQQTEITAERLFPKVNPPRYIRTLVQARTPDLSDFTRPLPQGKDIVLWVKTNDPPPPRPETHGSNGPVPRHYWRSVVYATYTSKGWQMDIDYPAQLALVNPHKPSAGRYELTQEFEIIAAHGQQEFAANQPIQTSRSTTILYNEPDDTTMVSGTASIYQVTSWASQATSEELDTASTQYPAEISRRYLQLPANLPDRIRQLSAHVVGQATTPLQKALRIQDYLRKNYQYSLDVKPAAAGRDFVDTFLFETQTGFCSHFASAMVIMLRVEGIPARIAAGYSMGSYDSSRGAYQVLASDAHAWVEAFFPGFGWIEFEPTPSQSTFSFGESLSTHEIISQDATPTPRPSLWERLRWGLISATLIVLLAVFLFLRRPRTESPLSVGKPGVFYWQMRRTLGRAGLHAPVSSTPSEFLEQASEALTEKQQLKTTIREVTYLYQQAAFGRVPPDMQQIDRVRKAWRRTLNERISLYFQNLLLALRNIFW